LQEAVIEVLLDGWRAQVEDLGCQREAALARLQKLIQAAALAPATAAPTVARAPEEGPPPSPEEVQDLISAIEGLQAAEVMTTLVNLLAIHGCLLRAEQVAAYSVAAHPFTPSLQAVDEGLRLLRAERAAASAAAADAPAAALGGGRGGGNAVRGRGRQQGRGGHAARRAAARGDSSG
jgi:hypothetical protein